MLNVWKEDVENFVRVSASTNHRMDNPPRRQAARAIYRPWRLRHLGSDASRESGVSPRPCPRLPNIAFIRTSEKLKVYCHEPE